MTVRERIQREASLACLVIASFILGGFLLWNEPVTPTGYSEPFQQASTPTVDETSGPVYVILTPESFKSPTMAPTINPNPTATNYPRCMPGEAKGGELCEAYPVLATTGPPTPIKVFPGVGSPTGYGELFFYPTETPDA